MRIHPKISGYSLKWKRRYPDVTRATEDFQDKKCSNEYSEDVTIMTLVYGSNCKNDMVKMMQCK